MDEATTTEIGISAPFFQWSPPLVVHLSRALNQNPWVRNGTAFKQVQKVSDVMVFQCNSVALTC